MSRYSTQIVTNIDESKIDGTVKEVALPHPTTSVRLGLYRCMKRIHNTPVRMISFNVPWQLLNRIDHHVHEEALPSRTQFLIRALEEALERANLSTTSADDDRG